MCRTCGTKVVLVLTRDYTATSVGLTIPPTVGIIFCIIPKTTSSPVVGSPCAPPSWCVSIGTPNMPTTRPKSKPEQAWIGYVVLTADGTIRGVMGLSMRHAAQKQRSKLCKWETGVKVCRRKLVKPPRVGDNISQSQVAI
jgi:hypothetical protein